MHFVNFNKNILFNHASNIVACMFVLKKPLHIVVLSYLTLFNAFLLSVIKIVF